MPDYSNGKIYKLVFGTGPALYVGSTTQPLHHRLHGHRSKGSKPIKDLVENVGRMNVRIILIENYPCSHKNELLSREQYWIDELKPVLNIKPAYIDYGSITPYNEVIQKYDYVVRDNEVLVNVIV